MSGLETDCAGLVDDEITVLEVCHSSLYVESWLIGQSVYDTLLTVHPPIKEKPGRLLSLDIPVSLSGPTTADLAPSFAATTPASSSSTSSLELSHLPPLKVRLALSPTYPLNCPPRVISIRAPLPASSGAWLSKRVLAHMQDRLVRMWAEDKELAGEGAAVVWRWWEWVGSGDFLQEIGMLQDGVLRWVPPQRHV